ncbi:MAG: hypothetical protein IJ537_06280 [Bacteroidaceae bacterium]|nr:hypothetical protein [Bacteroidaceae bacterium]
MAATVAKQLVWIIAKEDASGVVKEVQRVLPVSIALRHAVEAQQVILVQIVLTIVLLRVATIVLVKQTIMEEVVRNQMKYLQQQGKSMDMNMLILDLALSGQDIIWGHQLPQDMVHIIFGGVIIRPYIT